MAGGVTIAGQLLSSSCQCPRRTRQPSAAPSTSELPLDPALHAPSAAHPVLGAQAPAEGGDADRARTAIRGRRSAFSRTGVVRADGARQHLHRPADARRLGAA
ncbi:MAG: hypothetical protein MZW92_16105 [Comamonadaceae bacterium]|nr:hypothetical protein [Comamonadaceae bacterium]